MHKLYDLRRGCGLSTFASARLPLRSRSRAVAVTPAVGHGGAVVYSAADRACLAWRVRRGADVAPSHAFPELAHEVTALGLADEDGTALVLGDLSGRLHLRDASGRGSG